MPKVWAASAAIAMPPPRAETARRRRQSLGSGPISAGGRAGASLGEVMTGPATLPNNVEKLADTLVLAFSVTVQPPIPLQTPPQPANPQPLAGEAVRVTCVPAAKLVLQVEPQSIPEGALVTFPPGPPISETEREYERFWVNVAETLCDEFIVRVQVPVPLHAPLQPVKAQPAAGVAVSVTCVPTWKFALHVLGQLIAPGELATIPLPISLTDSG
jgi:hypothetical protein